MLVVCDSTIFKMSLTVLYYLTQSLAVSLLLSGIVVDNVNDTVNIATGYDIMCAITTETISLRTSLCQYRCLSDHIKTMRYK